MAAAEPEFNCGNVYSTLWHVTAFDESDHPIAGDASFAICNASLKTTKSPAGMSTEFNLIGNDQITCGNVHSTLWHVTAFDESDHPIASLKTTKSPAGMSIQRAIRDHAP
jgi:hypothetical protein